ncbi:MAG: helicase C-terminal domain-containing protein [Pelolinea sp.]|nr:helicase C-terminal domain-containing protein [Pelolinea sp.]
MFPIVALDLETTGLDSDTDAIIEIGAVKYDGDKVVGTWHSLINPQRPVPQMITQLTGIDSKMVAIAPPISAVLQDFVDFVGDSPIIGHNISFDLSFLKPLHDFSSNPTNDTFEIAAIILPSAPRYSLAALVDELEIENLSPHRAQEDADATLEVFMRLLEKARALPVQLIAEIVQSSKNIDWDGQWFFSQVLKEQSKIPIQARSVTQKEYGVLFSDPSELLSPPLKPNDEIIPLNVEEITEILSPGGLFSQYLENFEPRNEQIEMLQAVSTAISESQHLMVEAGTGIGKSYAYLVPAALWSTKNNLRMVISTNTINLQDQLMDKDIPDVRKALGINLRAAVLKGRANYLCPKRLQALRHRKPREVNELRLLGKVLVWLETGGKGNKNEITLTGPAEQEAWNRVSAQDESCNMEACLNTMGGSCPYFQARQSALSAHIVIVNHALLLSDVVANNRVLPDYKYLIVDEAHHIEDASTNALSYQVSRREIERLFSELGGLTSGVLGRILEITKKYFKPSDQAGVEKMIGTASDLAFRSENMIRTFFSRVDDFLEDEREGRPIGEYGQKVRVVPSTFSKPIWSEVEIAWDAASHPVGSLQRMLDQLRHDMVDETQLNDEEIEVVLGDLAAIVQRLQEMHKFTNAMVFDLDPGYIYWIEVDFRFQKLTLNFAPLHIGTLMENYLWHTKESVIVTSATLTANEQFDYIRSRLNADEADELVMGSPFDYENSAMLFLPTDMPEPSDFRAYQLYLTRAISQTAKATGGRMLVLFTSYKQLKATSQVITPLLAKEDIKVFEQGGGASASSLLDSFKKSERAVLLGTRSFWEGVDVPGEALSVLMITKLPFDVPSDPIIAARSETFENPFGEYTLPEAILRFRQGFGRLIRTQSDRGVVAVLDRRVRSKQYGPQFLHSLPACHIVEASIEQLPHEATRWLNI